jgi:aryl-alcohol dehydrogenase-like predicted oxidoreductase
VQQVHENLEHLGVDALDVVNLRVGGQNGPAAGSIARQFEALADLQERGLIRHLGVSNVDAEQIAEARTIAPVVEVQNLYNLAHRDDDLVVDLLADEEISYVPFFPLGGFSRLQSGELDAVAERLDATPMQVALAWLLQRSPNVLLIPGTSSVAHLKENLAAGDLGLPADAVELLDAIA